MLIRRNFQFNFLKNMMVLSYFNFNLLKFNVFSLIFAAKFLPFASKVRSVHFCI